MTFQSPLRDKRKNWTKAQTKKRKERKLTLRTTTELLGWLRGDWAQSALRAALLYPQQVVGEVKLTRGAFVQPQWVQQSSKINSIANILRKKTRITKGKYLVNYIPYYCHGNGNCTIFVSPTQSKVLSTYTQNLNFFCFSKQKQNIYLPDCLLLPTDWLCLVTGSNRHILFTHTLHIFHAWFDSRAVAVAYARNYVLYYCQSVASRLTSIVGHVRCTWNSREQSEPRAPFALIH